MTIPAVSAASAADVIERFETEARTRRLTGTPRRVATVLSFALALAAIAWVLYPLDALRYRVWFLLGVLALSFICYPASPSDRGNPRAVDWLLIGAALLAVALPLLDEQFPYRAAAPSSLDIASGVAVVVLVLEATRRSVGHVLPWTAVAFLLYAYIGPLFDVVGLELLAHRGYDVPRLVGTLFMTLEGMLGVPLDVASTYIVLFAIFAAVLERSGAGRFLVDWALAAVGRKGGAAGTSRAVTAAGFLLGTVSGSGVATAVTLGSVAWPMMRSVGIAADRGAAVLAAAGIGAVLSPPTLGAAAFLIAEYLRIPYARVLVMAIVPTILYYVSVMLMIEWDARHGAATAPAIRSTERLSALTWRGWHHFAALVSIIVFLGSGMTAVRAVSLATVVAVVLSWRSREDALGPGRLALALADGARGVVAIAATTATAGIIVGVMTLTGLGLRIAGLITDLAAGQLVPTLLLSAAAVLLLGLAVPVTASYIIAAVTVAPALTLVGVPAFAAHMFVFYYAVLSEVSPPTALAPFAAAAVTGADPWRATMMTWRYTVPAFLVPIAFTVTADGTGLLLSSSPMTALTSSVSAMAGVAALATGITGGPRGALSMPLRVITITAALLLIYPALPADAIGVVLLIPAIAFLRRSS